MVDEENQDEDKESEENNIHDEVENIMEENGGGQSNGNSNNKKDDDVAMYAYKKKGGVRYLCGNCISKKYSNNTFSEDRSIKLEEGNFGVCCSICHKESMDIREVTPEEWAEVMPKYEGRDSLM